MANFQYNPVETVAPTSGGTGASYGSVPEANPAAFGAGIGEAESKVGASAEDISKMYMQRANEANANDTIVNQWAPTVTTLSQDYYSKQGKDAVAGFQPYMQGLQDARNKLLQDATPAESQILNQYMTRHIAQEYDGAMRHQVQQMDVYENQMSDAFVGQQTTNAVNAGSNPDVINSAVQAGAARIQIHGIDRGQSPEIIQQQQNDFLGKTSQAVINSAIDRGDLSFANVYYANNKTNIPGAQQVDIDRVLHTENTKIFGDNAASAIMTGIALPHSPNGGVAATDVKSTVAGTAQSAGVDPNSSLMIAGIESSFGQNVGDRGDIGQTGKPAANISEQAKNLVDAQKQAQAVADKTVGGTAAPWQMYTVYQQGAGGGAALLDPQNASKRAVDVVSQFYKNPQDAKDAITKNGGNVTMTSSQFTDMLKQKCDTVYGQVKCDTATPSGQPIDLGQAIKAPHESDGIALQPATSPTQDLQQFNTQYPAMLQRAQEIPNIDQRNATIAALEKNHALKQGASSAYTNMLVTQATSMMAKPDFNMDQVKPELYSALATDHPETLIAMQNRAKENAAKASPEAKEALEKGPAFHQLNIGTEDGSDVRTTPEMVNKAYNDGQINSSAQDYLLNKIVGKKSLSPDEETYKTNAKNQAKSDMGFDENNPPIVAAYSDFNIAFDAYVDKAKADGKPISEIYSSKNVENVIKQFEPKYPDTLPAAVPAQQHWWSGLGTKLASIPLSGDRVVGRPYNTPKGKLVWTSGGWARPEDYEKFKGNQ